MTGADEWVVLHCYASFEDAVIERIRRRVPQAEVRRLRRESVYLPGFLLWRWEADSWEDVRKAGGVTGFVGTADTPEIHRLSELAD